MRCHISQPFHTFILFHISFKIVMSFAKWMSSSALAIYVNMNGPVVRMLDCQPRDIWFKCLATAETCCSVRSPSGLADAHGTGYDNCLVAYV